MHKFIIEKNGLFHCREEVALKKSIIEQHLKTEKHIRGKGKVASKEKREQDIAEALKLAILQGRLFGWRNPII